MKRFILFAVLFAVFVLAGCASTASEQVRLEQEQQGAAVEQIIRNQPVPDLGGFSFEREIVRQTFIARNNTIATYAYWFTYDGKIIEICPSIGYPIPYSTQLTKPEVPLYSSGGNVTVPNPEINGLYVPPDAAATLVQCVNADGTVSPVYIEENVQAFPFRIKSDYQIERIGESSFTVGFGK